MTITNKENAEPTKPNIRLAILHLVIVNVVLPLVIYSIAKNHTTEVVALTLSGIPPALDALYSIIRNKRIDIISSVTVLAIVLSVVVASLTNDAKLILVKDSFMTLVLGTTYLVSMVVGKENLIWHYNRQFAGTSPEAQAHLDELWQKEPVRTATKFMCLVWGIGLIFEAILRIVLIYSLPISTMAYLSPILITVVLGSLAVWNALYVKLLLRRKAAYEAKLAQSEIAHGNTTIDASPYTHTASADLETATV